MLAMDAAEITAAQPVLVILSLPQHTLYFVLTRPDYSVLSQNLFCFFTINIVDSGCCELDILAAC